MYIVGLDLGKRKSQVCVGLPDGTLVEERRVATTPEALSSFFARYQGARVLLESSTSSEWVARHLESLGHEVVVGDPRFGPMYAQADRRIKTDKRDGRGLMQALRLGAYRPAHRRSDSSRDLRDELLVRASLVKNRSRIAIQLRALLERRGIILGRCAVEDLAPAVEGTELPDALLDLVAPLLEQLKSLDELITTLDKRFEQLVEASEDAKRLDAVPGVGPVTALAFLAAIGDISRFKTAQEVASYLGFVPRESSSGEKQRRGTTTKSGDKLTRSYLIQAAWSLRRSKKPEVEALQHWADAVEQRRGKKVATTALARRLVRIFFAVCRDQEAFSASKLAAPA